MTYNSQTMLDVISAGDRVTIRIKSGRNLDGTYDTIERTGRAVMRGPHGWVLNMGGRHGTPAIADNENIVLVKKGKR